MIVERTLKEEFAPTRDENSDLSERFRMNFPSMTNNSYDWPANTELNTVALQAQRHNNQRARGHNPHGSTQQ